MRARLAITKVGKPAFDAATRWTAEYRRRINRFGTLDYRIVKPAAADAAIEKIIRDREHLIVLDERGFALTSVAFADRLSELINAPEIGRPHFVIGGPDGLTADQKDAASEMLRLSNFVLQGDLADVVLHEQIYRALNIIAGTSYHHA